MSDAVKSAEDTKHTASELKQKTKENVIEESKNKDIDNASKTASSVSLHKVNGLDSILQPLPRNAILLIAFVMRVLFFIFGLYQDSNMPLPYTDIDYYVFTDAAKFVSFDKSPFLRATYRYTPLLSWILIPTTFTSHELWFSFGKFIFIICDLLTGYISMVSLPVKFQYFSLIWLFNPMVVTISTRGSSESLLTLFVLLSAYFLVKNNGKSVFDILISGIMLGISIHLKLYPIIYLPSYLLYIDSVQPLYWPITFKRLILLLTTIASFGGLTYWMFTLYGDEYLNEAFFYHFIRLDHRHNFSIYNVPLYLNSVVPSTGYFTLEKLAFVPQLLLSVVIIPLCFIRGLQSKDSEFNKTILYKIMFIQTFVFIMLNKVCTSQYFIWFLCILPQYLVSSTISRTHGLILLLGWILTQGLWLFNGWRLEFVGTPDIFITGLFFSSCAFFIWNTYLAYCFLVDVKQQIQIQQKQEMELKTKKVE